MAAAVGLSPGSLRYQFPSQARVIELGMRHLPQDRAQHRLYRAAYQEHVREASDPEADYVTARRAYLRALCLASLPLDEERLVQAKAWQAFEDPARHDPVVGAVSFRGYQERLAARETWLRIVGVPDAKLRIEALALLALLDGLVAGVVPTDRPVPGATTTSTERAARPVRARGSSRSGRGDRADDRGRGDGRGGRLPDPVRELHAPEAGAPPKPTYTVIRARED
ncbi:MAG TPA: TetR family transcriptional regulator C-terminal domain-containing protein [Nocardioides sp.]